MDDYDDNNKQEVSKRRGALFIKLVVFIGIIFCFSVRVGKHKPPPPKPVLKIHPDYPLTKDRHVKQGDVSRVPTQEPLPSAPPTKEPPPPFLELNTENTISKDVSRLWHNEEMGAVCISIPLNATCSHPFFIGRLSGPSLSILKWHTSETTTSDDHELTTFCGNYDGVTHGAIYSLEILTVYCKDFSVGALSAETSSTSPRHTDEWLSFNWAPVCMQPPLKNRLTQENSRILISNSALPMESRNELNDTEPQLQVPGYWTRNETENLIPLYTRFQPMGCQGEASKLPRCKKHMGTDRFDGYEFSWASRILEEWKSQNIPNRFQANNTDLQKECDCERVCSNGRCRQQCVDCIQRKTQPTSPMENGKKVCIVGASHSYHLKYSIDRMQMSHLFHWIPTRWPAELGEAFFERRYRQLGCRIFVIGFGQWPASHLSSPPYSFERYLAEMTRIAHQAEESPGPFQVYMRSMHQMPILDWTSICPPKDWRTPAVVNGYNYLLEQAVIATTESSSSPKVHFLDTRFITNPMWDIAYDWYHIQRKVADMEALYIASVVLSG